MNVFNRESNQDFYPLDSQRDKNSLQTRRTFLCRGMGGSAVQRWPPWLALMVVI